MSYRSYFYPSITCKTIECIVVQSTSEYQIPKSGPFDEWTTSLSSIHMAQISNVQFIAKQ
jgi:hypothetical protein